MLQQMFRRKWNRKTGKVSHFKPSLEYLERRFLLAGNTLTWTGLSGVDLKWATVGNWNPNNLVPQTGDNLIFNNNTPNSTANSTGISLGYLSFDFGTAKLTLQNSYTFSSGTASTITSGAIDGNGAGNALKFPNQVNVSGGTFQNDAVLQVLGGGTMTLSGGTQLTFDFSTLDNLGTISWTDATKIALQNQSWLKNENGASLNISGSGNVTNPDGSATKFINDGTVTKTGTGGTSISVSSFSNDSTGTLAVNGGRFSVVGTGTTITQQGTISMGGGTFSVTNSPLTNDLGTIKGYGTLSFSLQSSGTVHPGPSGGGGVLNVSGDYTQHAPASPGTTIPGALGVDIDALGNIGYLAVSGTATLDGSVTVTRNTNFLQTSGTFTFLQAGKPLVGGFTSFFINNNSWSVDGHNYYLAWIHNQNGGTYGVIVQRSSSPQGAAIAQSTSTLPLFIGMGQGNPLSATTPQATPVTLASPSQNVAFEAPTLLSPARSANDIAKDAFFGHTAHRATREGTLWATDKIFEFLG